MDSIKCSGAIDIVSELNLTTLNEDCQRHIFYFLHWADIINLADTSKPLRAAVCLIFQRKIRNAKIDIGHFKGDRYVIITKLKSEIRNSNFIIFSSRKF